MLYQKKTLDVTKIEIKKILGGMFLFAISPQSNKRKYWSSGDHVPKILSDCI